VTRRLIAECVCADDPRMAQAEAAIVRAASVISQCKPNFASFAART
jgi:hypothetical protein